MEGQPTPQRYEDEITYDDVGRDINVGVVVPFDFSLDWEYWRYLPEGVWLHFTRTPYLKRGVGIQLARQVGKPSVVARATKALTSLNPSATLYACSSGSFVHGLAGEQEIRDAMLAAGARRAITSSGAMIDALHAVGAKRVAVATPYTRTLTARLTRFLEDAAFQPVSAVHLGLKSGIDRVSRETVANLIRRAAHPQADAVLLSCTALRTFGIVAALEEELRIPILTSNQVSLWAALDAAGALVPERLDEGWVLGGGEPMADSTRRLLDASDRARQAGEVAVKTQVP